MSGAPLPSLAAIAAAPGEALAGALALCLSATALPVLLRALDLGVFARLAGGPERPGDLALALAGDADPVPIAMTLELACAQGLLTARDGHLELAEVTRLCFLADSPLRLLGLVERHRRYVTAIGALPDALRSMRAADRRLWSGEVDAEAQSAYFEARRSFNAASRGYFRDSALLLARAHAERDFAAHRVLCDVGAGPAAFAAIVQRAAPHLRVYAAELDYRDPVYRAATADDLREAGAAVELLACNLLHEALPPDIDLLTVNRVFSGLDRAGAEGWARRLFASLAPGGTLALVDFFTVGARAHDRAVGDLYALWMAWNQHELARDPPTDPRDDRRAWGWNPPWGHHELAALLTRAGFVEVRARSVVPPFALVEARRP